MAEGTTGGKTDDPSDTLGGEWLEEVVDLAQGVPLVAFEYLRHRQNCLVQDPPARARSHC